MKTLQDIANLIVVRNFLADSINNERIKLSKEELKNAGTCVKAFDQTIVQLALKLDVSALGKEPVVKTEVRHYRAESTEDTETVFNRYAGQPREIKVVHSNTKTDPLTGMTFIEAPADETPESK